MRQLVDRHAQRCPSQVADGSAHEHTFARFHQLPPPMFMATARIDAVWIHDGLLDARDYKTGRLCVRPRRRRSRGQGAGVRARATAAQRRGPAPPPALRVPEPDVDDDPDPWEPDPDDLAAIEEELRAAVERMRTVDDWKGVAEANLCSHCAYRSICRDSAAPGDAAWPVLGDHRRRHRGTADR